MQLRFAESWMSDLETKLEETWQLDDRSRDLIRVTAQMTLEGEREGLVELI